MVGFFISTSQRRVEVLKLISIIDKQEIVISDH